MITFISFALIILGALNWLSIGALQYDFVAGLFGSQASMFSRIVYFFIGVTSVWIVIQLIRGKGRIKINDDGFEKTKHTKNDTKAFQSSRMEADRDFADRRNETHYPSEKRHFNIDDYEIYEDNGGRFPRDFSRYKEEIQNIKEEKTDSINYKSLGYKDFNEEDLDR